MLRDLEPLSTTWGAYAFVVFLGMLWGSFANVCIYRMPPSDEFPNGRSVITPGSHCFACKAPVKWYDNVPLLAWLWLRGRCRNCKAEFSARYLIVEALTGALFGLAWWFTMVPNFTEPFDTRLIRFGIYAAFIVVLVVIAFIDLDTMLILDKVTYPSIVVFYGLSLLLPEHRWYDGLIGAGLGFGVIWGISTLYLRLRGREGMGLGDAKLLALVGALLGWRGFVASLFGGSIIGTLLTLVAIGVTRGRSTGSSETSPRPAETPDEEGEQDGEDDGEADDTVMGTELPFGPYLVIGALFYLFAQPWIDLNLGV